MIFVKTQTPLSEYIYLHGPFEKLTISPEILLEIGQAYCDREGYIFCESGFMEAGIAYVEINASDETLEMHHKFQKAFSEMGYSSVLLEVNVMLDE